MHAGTGTLKCSLLPCAGWTATLVSTVMMLEVLQSRPFESSKSSLRRPGKKVCPIILASLAPTDFQDVGYDPPGAQHFKHKLRGSRKWIGTTEIYTAFTYLGIRSVLSPLMATVLYIDAGSSTGQLWWTFPRVWGTQRLILPSSFVLLCLISNMTLMCFIHSNGLSTTSELLSRSPRPPPWARDPPQHRQGRTLSKFSWSPTGRLSR
jgi:hypothetical protein